MQSLSFAASSCVLVLLATAARAAPQAAPAAAPAAPDIVASDAGARMVRVGAGVYAILHDDATDEWPHGNSGVIVGADAVAVVDSTYLPSRAAADIALIRAVTDKPVTHLFNTHWHFDHNNGAISYRDAFPAVVVVAERHSADFIELNATWWSRMSVAEGSARRASTDALRERLAAGTGEDGQPLSAGDRATLEDVIARRQAEQAELSTLRVVKPDLLFDGQLDLLVGGRRIELRDHGPANSPHDVTIHLPDDHILFAGDLVVQSPLPYFGASWPLPWVEVLRAIESMPLLAIVPGHGPVLRDATYPARVRALLEAATTRVTAMVRRGLTLAQIQEQIDLSDVRAGTPEWTGAALDADWKLDTDMLVERVWRGVRGQG